MGSSSLRLLFFAIAVLHAADDRQRAADLVKQSEASAAKGQYDQAADALTQALAIHQRLGDDERVAEDWNGIGRARIYSGDYAGSVQAFERALALDRKRGDAQGEVVRLYNLGNAYYELGRYSDAHRQYQAALDRVQSSGNQPWVARRRQIAVSNMAILFQRLGRYQQALELYRSLEASGQTMLPSERAQLLANQGALYRRLGDPVKALETYQAAQKLFAQDRHPFGEINVMRNIGIAQALDLGRVPDALGTFTNARMLAQKSDAASQLPSLSLYIAEALRELGRIPEAKAEFEAALAGARKLNAKEQEWRALYGLGQVETDPARAAELFDQAIAAIESVRANLGIASLRRDFLADKRQVYDAAIGLRLKRSEPPLDEIFRLMENSRARVLQDEMARPDRKAIQARLPENAVLLEYWSGGAVLVLTRNAARVTRRQSVDVTRLREAAMGQGDWKQQSAEAGKALLSGLPEISQAAQVIVVPDNSLALAPFEMLALENGRLLIEQAAVSYLPSAALMLRDDWGAPPPSGPPWKQGLMAFADPEHLGPGLFEGGKPLHRLPQAQEEVRYISKLTPGRSEVYFGPAAVKAPLLSLAGRGIPILHLATHGTADYVDPERSRILFASPKLSQSADFLFLREIYGLNLKGCDLVVLSACDTETGKLVGGEGVEGFGKAFLTAGARSVISTLWRVGDQSSAEFMKQFYHALAAGQTKAEALRTAKLRFLASGELTHPRYWAAFLLSGDGSTPAARYWSWMWIAGAAALLLAAAVFTVRSSR